MMKKVTAIILTLILLITLVACNNNKPSNNDNNVSDFEKETPIKIGPDGTKPGTVLYDDSKFKIIFDGFTIYENFPCANFTIENNTNHVISVSSLDISVDGYVIDGYDIAYFDVPAKGKKSEKYKYFVPGSDLLSFKESVFDFFCL